MQAIDWVATIINGPLAVITCTCTAALCLSMFRFSQSVERISRKQLIASSTLSNICYSIAAMLYFTEDVIYLSDVDPCVLGKFALFWHFFARTTMILVFTIRIENTFKRSSMEYSVGVLRTLYALAICLGLFYISLIVLVLLKQFLLSFIFIICWISFYVILSIVLVTMFIRKMDQVMAETAVMRTQELSNYSLSSISRAAVAAHQATSSSTQVTPGQPTIDEHIATTPAAELAKMPSVKRSSTIKQMVEAQFLFVVTKHALLVPLAVCSSFILAGLPFVVGYKIGRQDVCFGPFASMWEALDCTISAMCNYLLFGCNVSVYNLLCFRFHRLCEKWKLWQVKRKVNRKLDRVRTNSVQQGMPDESKPIPDDATMPEVPAPSLKTSKSSSMKKKKAPSLRDTKSLSLVQHDSNGAHLSDTKALPNMELS